MADPELIAYIAKHSKLHGDSAVRTQLIRDGLPPSEIDQAFAEAQMSTMRKQKKKKRLALFAVGAGGLLLAMAAMLSREPAKPAGGEEAAVEAPEEPTTFHGHYGYMLRLPIGYRATQDFIDAEKRDERVYIYPAGTDSSHFIHEGLYAHMGILRLEVAPRRVPQGFIGIDTLKNFVKRKLDYEKSVYQMRDLIVHGMPGFVVTSQKPFQYVRAYMVGEKVRFMLVGGKEDALFTDILSSLAEVSPHDRPGR